MRVFWLNHGLHVDPENQGEVDLLKTLAGLPLRFMTRQQAVAEQELSVEPRAELIVANHEFVPGDIAG